MKKKKLKTRICLNILNENLEKLKANSEKTFNSLSGIVNSILQKALEKEGKNAD